MGMIGSTLGGLIKDHRLKTRISQLDISLKMGWKDTSRLSKIEQGRVSKPKRETIDRLLDALSLDKFERGDFLFNAGYLPTDEEIKAVIKEVSPKIDSWPYPAYLMDFSWRWLYTNIHDLVVFALPLSIKDKVFDLKINMLEVPFLPKEQFKVEVWKGEDKDHLNTFEVAQIAAFKTENYKFQNESWYKKVVIKLMKNDRFRELWPRIGVGQYHKKLFDYEYKRVKGVIREEFRTLNFHVFTNKVISSPQLQVVLYYPADEQTTAFFQK